MCIIFKVGYVILREGLSGYPAAMYIETIRDIHCEEYERKPDPIGARPKNTDRYQIQVHYRLRLLFRLL